MKLTSQLVALFAVSLPAFCGEYAVFPSGSRLRIERHESSGGMVRLYTSGGITEMAEASVVAFEQDDAPPAAPPPVPVSSANPAVPKDALALLRGAALKAGLPTAFVESVAKTESALNQKAVSPKGAIGVMQLMPETARSLGADPSDIEQNIDAGTRLLRDLLLKYNGDVVKALAAYNAGSAAVDRYNGLPPYTETQNYVNKVIRGYLDHPSGPAASGAAQ